MLRKTILLLLLFISISYVYGQQEIEKIISERDYYIHLYENDYFYADIVIRNGVIDCLYPLSNSKVWIAEDMIYIETEKHSFKRNVTEQSIYRDFYFPKRYVISISYDELLDATADGDIDKLLDTSSVIPTSATAVIIEDSDILETPEQNGVVIGDIKKRTEVILYDESSSSNNEISKSKYYKIKLKNGLDGWILSTNAKIYFENEYMGKQDKAGILKSIQ